MEITARSRRDPVRQLSVFAENKVGTLNDIVQRLGLRDVHILAFSLVDSTECSIMRFVVDDVRRAKEIFRGAGLAVVETTILAVQLTTEADIKFVTAALVEAEINIHYLYPFVMRPNGRSGLAISLEDVELADQVLRCHGLQPLDQTDLSR